MPIETAGGGDAGRICGPGRAVFVHRARGAVPANHPLRKIRNVGSADRARDRR